MYVDGVKLYKGEGYTEVGLEGNASNQIRFLKVIPTTSTISYEVRKKAYQDNAILNNSISLVVLDNKIAEALQAVRRDIILDEDMPINTIFEVPQYTVNTNTLYIYMNGILCVNDKQYAENGEDGAISDTITWLTALEKDTAITAIAPNRVS